CRTGTASGERNNHRPVEGRATAHGGHRYGTACLPAYRPGRDRGYGSRTAGAAHRRTHHGRPETSGRTAGGIGDPRGRRPAMTPSDEVFRRRNDALRAEIIAASRRTEHLVASSEELFEKRERLRKRLVQVSVSAEIEPALGVVKVSGDGRIAIELEDAR